MAKEISLTDVRGLVGTETGLSDWIVVDQAMIDAFAHATNDHQFIHVDPGAPLRVPFGGTIAHGFLTLSLLSAMNYNSLPKVREQTMGINYGFENVRFLAPVKSGARIRGHFVLAEARFRGAGMLMTTLRRLDRDREREETGADRQMDHDHPVRPKGPARKRLRSGFFRGQDSVSKSITCQDDASLAARGRSRSRRAVHFDDVPIRIEQVGPRKARDPIADEQSLGIAFDGILAKSHGGQPADRALEIICSEGEMGIGAVDGRRFPERAIGVEDDVHLKRAASRPGTGSSERRPLDPPETEDVAVESDGPREIRGDDGNVMQHHRNVAPDRWRYTRNHKHPRLRPATRRDKPAMGTFGRLRGEGRVAKPAPRPPIVSRSACQ